MSEINEAIKNMVRAELDNRQSAGTSVNRLGTVSQVNDDGTAYVLVDGRGIQCDMLHPAVVGQQVIVMPSGQGTYKAAPTQPNPNTIVIEPGKFFTGGANRFAVGHQFNDIPGQNEMAVDFQDQGSNKIFRLTFPDLLVGDNWTFAGSGLEIDTQIDGSLNGIIQPFHQFSNFFPFAFSEDGAAFAVAFNQLGAPFGFTDATPRSAKVRLYKIGTNMKSAGDIDPANQIFKLDATLIQEITGICAQNTQSPTNIDDPAAPISWQAYQELSIQMSLFVTRSVADDGTVNYKTYFMSLFRRVATQTSITPFPGLPNIGVTCLATPANINNNSLFSNLYLAVFLSRIDGTVPGTVFPLYELVIDIILIFTDPAPIGGGTNFWSFLKLVPIAIVDIVDDLSRVRILGILPQTQNLENNHISNLNYDGVPSQYVLMDVPVSGPMCASTPFPNPPFGSGNYSGLFQALTPVYLSPFINSGIVFETSNYFQPLVTKDFSCVLIPDGSGGIRAFTIKRKDGTVSELPFTPNTINGIPGGGLYGLIETAKTTFLYLVEYQPVAPPGLKRRAEIYNSPLKSGTIVASKTAEVITPGAKPPRSNTSVKSIQLTVSFFSNLLTMVSS